ncbi:unnamed protein product [Cylicostephanus goldi]|uniref:Uncharacterized protein n=1 Tax=Cylicostephanus goldi TaxID=71465 RepID=A0A3P6RUK2_CYLGO|nr:unnamed protein product [Cylicostephanus goldi]
MCFSLILPMYQQRMILRTISNDAGLVDQVVVERLIVYCLGYLSCFPTKACSIW